MLGFQAQVNIRLNRDGIIAAGEDKGQAAVEALAEEGAEMARLLADSMIYSTPMGTYQRTGDLRAGIQVRKGGYGFSGGGRVSPTGRSITAQFGCYGVFYAALVDQGTAFMAARPFMSMAATYIMGKAGFSGATSVRGSTRTSIYRQPWGGNKPVQQ